MPVPELPGIQVARECLYFRIAAQEPFHARRIVQGVATVYAGTPVPFYTAAGISRSAIVTL